MWYYVHVDDVWCDKLKITENSLEQSLLEYEKVIFWQVKVGMSIQLNDDLNNVTVKLKNMNFYKNVIEHKGKLLIRMS